MARVGDAPITEKQLTTTIEQSRAQAKEQGQTLPAEGEDGYDQVRQQALQQLIQQEVVAQRGPQVRQALRGHARPTSRPSWRASATPTSRARRRSSTPSSRRARSPRPTPATSSKNQLQQQKLLNHVTRGIRFTAADAAEVLRRQPGPVHGRRRPHGARTSWWPTKAEADAIRAEVTSANFAELAKENSTDTGSAAAGRRPRPDPEGPAGPGVREGRLRPEGAARSRSRSRPSSAGTSSRWTITPATTTSFEEAKSQIISSQLAAKRQAAWTAWGEKALKAAEERTVYADRRPEAGHHDGRGARHRPRRRPPRRQP